MWLQILLTLLPTLGVAAPLLGFSISKLKNRTELALTARSDGSNRSLPAAPLPEIDGSIPARKTMGNRLEEGAQRFGSSLRSLEQRAMENSNNNIYGYIASLIEELQTLEHKLQLSAIDQQARLTYAKYLPMVKKLVELTAPNYYGDFVRNPDHWNDPKRMRIQVELSVLAVAKEASEDIRRLNSSQELDFKVSVESLIGKAAASADERDPDAALEALLAADDGPLGQIAGDLESLQLAVSAEALTLKAKQEDERRQAELEAKKFRAGSKANLEAPKAPVDKLRKVLISRDLFKQNFTIYTPSSSSDKFSVSHSDEITGQINWKQFKSAYEAADWVDSAIVALENKHDYKCNCVYCRRD